MGKGRVTALFLAVVVIGLALMRTATASHQSSHKAFSGGATFKGLVVKTETENVTVTSVVPDWQTIDSRGFEIPAGDSQLVVADFSVDGFCTSTCVARVLMGRTLGTAVAAQPDEQFMAFLHGDSIAGVHTLTRTLCLRNATASPATVNVWVQAAKFAASNGYSISNYTFKVARNSPCSPSQNI